MSKLTNDAWVWLFGFFVGALLIRAVYEGQWGLVLGILVGTFLILYKEYKKGLGL